MYSHVPWVINTSIHINQKNHSNQKTKMQNESISDNFVNSTRFVILSNKPQINILTFPQLCNNFAKEVIIDKYQLFSLKITPKILKANIDLGI